MMRLLNGDASSTVDYFILSAQVKSAILRGGRKCAGDGALPRHFRPLASDLLFLLAPSHVLGLSLSKERWSSSADLLGIEVSSTTKVSSMTKCEYAVIASAALDRMVGLCAHPRIQWGMQHASPSTVLNVRA